MSKRLILDVDKELGMAQFVEADEDGVTLITQGTNVKAALDQNARLRSENTSVRRGTQTWGHHVASIPMWLYEQFCRENPELRSGSKDAQAWLMARLNDPEYAHLRTYDGRI